MSLEKPSTRHVLLQPENLVWHVIGLFMSGEHTDPDSSSAKHMLKSLSQISEVFYDRIGEDV